MASVEEKDALASPEDEKLNGSTSKPQEATAETTKKDSILKKIWKKADLNPPTIMLMLK